MSDECSMSYVGLPYDGNKFLVTPVLAEAIMVCSLQLGAAMTSTNTR
jgi:hypothetical protein